ncbi:MAG: sialate O-acetylesterase [Bacteroidales bacterium]|nr:sialate O-acetylesterase [Bacteroidales bacterium]
MEKYHLLLIGLSSIVHSLQAQVVMPKIFSDNLVLQRNTPIPVWGWATPNEKIKVIFNKQNKSIKADINGNWMVKLGSENVGGPYELVVKGKNTIQIKNVLVGEVWLCSGQSNMEWTVGQSNHAKKEIASANYPFIRHIKVSRTINSLPQTDIGGGVWKVCDAATVSDFSAVAYYFAKEIYAELKIPIGLINASWGGTNIETWISREVFESSDEFKEMIAGMTKINLDSLSRAKVKASELRIESLQGTKLKALNANFFNQLSFDDSTWPELIIPQLWEQQSGYFGDTDPPFRSYMLPLEVLVSMSMLV